MGDTFNPSIPPLINEIPNTSVVAEVNAVRRRMSPMIFLNTRFIERVAGWTGALNQNTRLGCGVNVLHFLGLLSRETAINALYTPNIVHPVNGLSLTVIVQKFNELFQASCINRRVYFHTINIRTREALREQFDDFQALIVPDSCMLVRYGRHADPQHRILHPNPDPQLLSQYPDGVPISEGHYVIIAKTPTGQLTTIDPHASQMHDYNGTISDNFWNVWHNINGYISIEFLYCYDPNVLAGGALKGDAAYIVPNKVMKQFVNDLLNSYECVHPRKTKSISRSQRISTSQHRSKTKNIRKSIDAKPPKKREKTRRTI
jgi:hypothetical protein